MKRHIMNWLFAFALLVLSFIAKLFSQKISGVTPFDTLFIFIGIIFFIATIIIEPISTKRKD
jgi:hypothetical protein